MNGGACPRQTTHPAGVLMKLTVRSHLVERPAAEGPHHGRAGIVA